MKIIKIRYCIEWNLIMWYLIEYFIKRIYLNQNVLNIFFLFIIFYRNYFLSKNGNHNLIIFYILF